jgi:hypothetical protein
MRKGIDNTLDIEVWSGGFHFALLIGYVANKSTTLVILHSLSSGGRRCSVSEDSLSRLDRLKYEVVDSITSLLHNLFRSVDHIPRFP